MGSCISSPESGKERVAKHVASSAGGVGVNGVKAFATTGSTPGTLARLHQSPGSEPPDDGAVQSGHGQQTSQAAEKRAAGDDMSARTSPVYNAAAEAGQPSSGSHHPASAQPSPPAAASPDPTAAAKTAAAPSNARHSSSSRRQGPNVPRRRGSASNLRRGGATGSRHSSNAGVDDGVALPLTAAQMNEALDDAAETPVYGSLSATPPPPPPAALDSTVAVDSTSSTSTVRSRNASYSAGGPEVTAAVGAAAKPTLGSGLSRLGFGGPAAAAAAAAALMDSGGPGAGAGRGTGAASSRDVPWLAGGGGGGGEESDAVPELAAARQSKLGERSSGSGAPLPTGGISVPLAPPGGRPGALPFSASMPHGPQAPGQLQPVVSAAPPPPPMQRDASAFRFDPALLASLRLTPSASVASTIPPADSLGGQPGTAGPGPGSDHPRPPGAAHHLSFTHHGGRPQGHPSGAVTGSEDTDTDGRPSESGPSYTGLGGGVGPRKASFSRPPPGPNSGRRRGGGEGPQPRPSSGAQQLEAVATAAANQVAALLHNPLPSIPSGGLAPGAEDPGIQTLLSLGLVNAAAYRRARQRASEAGGAGAAGGGGGGGGGAGSGPQNFTYQQQVHMQMQMQAAGGSPGGPPGPGMPGRKVRRSSCTEAYGHGPYAYPPGYGYGAPQNRQLQHLGTMSRAAEGGNSGGAGGRSQLNADAAFGMVRRTASVAVPKDAQAAIAAAAAAAAALAAEGQGAGGNSGRGRQRRASYSIFGS